MDRPKSFAMPLLASPRYLTLGLRKENTTFQAPEPDHAILAPKSDRQGEAPQLNITIPNATDHPISERHSQVLRTLSPQSKRWVYLITCPVECAFHRNLWECLVRGCFCAEV